MGKNSKIPTDDRHLNLIRNEQERYKHGKRAQLINKCDAWQYDHDDPLPSQCMCEPIKLQLKFNTHFLFCMIWLWLLAYSFFSSFRFDFYSSFLSCHPISKCQTHKNTHKSKCISRFSGDFHFPRLKTHMSYANSFNSSLWMCLMFAQLGPSRT